MPVRPRLPSASCSTPASPTRWARSTTARPSWTGWSRSASAASPLPRRPPPASGRGWTAATPSTASTSSTRPGHVDFTIEVERSHARARRRVHGVRLRGRRAAAIGNGVAAGQQVQRAAARVRQQDGPCGRQLLQGLRPDEVAPQGQPGADPGAHRRRGQVRGRGRPRQDEGDLLGRLDAGHEVRDARHPGRPRRHCQGMAREDGGERRRSQRRGDEQVPRDGRAFRRGNQAQPARAHHRGRDRADALRLRVQEQGRAGDARRGHRLHAGADGHPAGEGRARKRQGSASASRRTTSRSRRSRSRS